MSARASSATPGGEPRPLTRAEHLGLSLACLVMALGAVLPVLRLDGLPHNHEFLSAFERAEGFRRAFAAGDFLPLWTPFCFNGHGSPWPFFYHRLFTTLSGGLGWMLGSSFCGVWSALVLVLFVGTLGLAAAARRLGVSPLMQVFAALVFCFSPYVFFDWLVRGALAELTALALYPWLVWACLRLLEQGRGGLAAGLFFTLLFYAHTVMFLFALPTFAVAVGFVLARRGWRSALTEAGLAALPVLVLCAPYALLLLRLEKRFNTAALATFLPDKQFVSLGRYVWDTEFHWGDQWEGVTPELGPALLASLLGLALLALVSRGERTGGRGAGLTFLLVPAAFCAVLQTPLATAFYQDIPFTRLLQFPWRLVGFLTVLLVLVWSVLGDAVTRRGGWRASLAWGLMATAAGAGLLLGGRATHPHYGVTRRSTLEAQLAELDGPESMMEYLPREVATASGLTAATPFFMQRGCERVTQAPEGALDKPSHLRRLSFTVSSPEGCRILFNQYRTPFLALESSSDTARVDTDATGTLQLVLPPGEHHVELRQRGFFELLWRELGPGA